MRRIVVLASIAVLIFGGCWAANHRLVDEKETGDSVIDTGDEAEPSLEEIKAAEVEVEVEPQLEPALFRLEGERYTAFDFLQNRPLAHRITTTPTRTGVSFWADAQALDFVRYIQGNHANDWLPFAEVGGEVAAGTRGREAKLTMPSAPEAEALEMRIFNPARGDNFLTVTINGQDLERRKLEAGWQRLHFDLADLDIRGENDLELSFSNLGRIEGHLSGGALRWARLGPTVNKEPVDNKGPALIEETPEPVASPQSLDLILARALAEAEAEIMRLDVSNQKNLGQGPVDLLLGEGLSWVVWLHDDAVLDIQLSGEPGCGLRAEVLLEAGEGALRTQVVEERLLVEGRGRRQETTIELDLEDSQVGRVSLTQVGGDDCAAVRLEGARLARPGTQAKRPESIEPPEYILFWVIDTLRADYLPIHFETDVQAPNLSRLAEEGVSFEVAYVQGTESRASHASLFTGLYPERHGVLGRGRVDRNLLILPHFLQRQGYATSLIAGNGYVSHLLNLNRGWDHYQNNIHDETGLSAAAMMRDGLKWLDAHGEDPYFLYIGTIDPHVTYRRHDGIIDLYEPEPYRGRFRRNLSGEDLGRIKGGHLSVTEREREWIINLYKNEITYNDRTFGELREELESRGMWDRTLVVVTSDHGEEFWEHGSVGHGHNVHQEMVHVPLIFYYPRGLPQGLSLRTGAEVIDVLPTVMEIVGGEVPDDRQGMSLLAAIYGEDGGYPAPAVATQQRRHYGMQIEHWKLYLRSGRMALYDRRYDVEEHVDVRQDHPLASRWLQDSVGWFRAYREQWDKASWGVTNNVSARFLEFVAEESP